MTHAPTATLAIALLLAGAPARALSGGGFDLSHNAIASGGATFSSGGGYQLGGTIGQAAAGRLTGGAFTLHGGFWSAPLSVATSTATATAAVNPPTATPPPSVTATRPTTPSVTATRPTTPTPTAATPLATSSPTRSSAMSTPTHGPTTLASPSITPTHGPTTLASPSITPTPSPTPTPDPEICSGDCNRDGTVTVNELIRGVNIALGNAAVDTCAAMDGNADGAVAVNELIAAVNRTLRGCPTTGREAARPAI